MNNKQTMPRKLSVRLAIYFFRDHVICQALFSLDQAHS